MHRVGRAPLAFLIVASSLTAAYAFDAAGWPWAARLTLLPRTGQMSY
jgi:hypothetical protein